MGWSESESEMSDVELVDGVIVCQSPSAPTLSLYRSAMLLSWCAEARDTVTDEPF